MRLVRLAMSLFGVLAALALWGSCTVQNVIVTINVNGLLPEVGLLRVDLTLNGRPALEGEFEITQNLDRFAVRLPNIDQSYGLLEVNIGGIVEDGCRISAGKAAVQLMPGTFAVEVSVALTPLPEKLCRVTVVRSGAGTVISEPPGIDCGDRCAGDFPISKPMRLTASRVGIANLAANWSGDCTGSRYGLPDSCTLTVTKPMKVNIRFAGGFCGPEGWCWEERAPQGYTLRSVFGSGSNNVWMVGDYGTILHWDGAQMIATNSGTTARLNGVWTSSSTNTWAVGAKGTILHWDGEKWGLIPSGTTQNLNGIWGSGLESAWAVGDSGTFLEWSNTFSQWSPIIPKPSEPSNLMAITGTGAGLLSYVNLWVGASNKTWRWDGTSWTSYAQNLSITGLSGSAGNNIWGIEFLGQLFHWDGMNWSKIGNPEPNGGLRLGIWGNSPSSVWVVSTAGYISRWYQSTWTAYQLDLMPQGALYAIWGSSSNDIWVVGGSGRVARWNGQWTGFSSSASPPLSGIWGSSPNDIWSVGAQGTIKRWLGDRWISVPSGTTNDLTAIWGSRSNDVWAVGNGALLRWQGSQWSAVTLNPDEKLTAIWGSGPSDIWAVGSKRFLASPAPIVHWDGSQWIAVPSNATKNLTAIWGSGPDDVWAAGQAGTMIHWDGSQWLPVPSNTTSDLNALAGSESKNVFAVGAGGTVLRWDGGKWTFVSSETNDLLTGIRVNGPTDVYVLGYSPSANPSASIRKWDGTKWTPILENAHVELYNLWVSGPRDIWAVGSEGAILHY